MPMPWLDVPHLPQPDDGWCLPACVAMVSAYWGEPVLQADVARWLETSEIGTPSRRVQRLTRHGYDVVYGEGSLANLIFWLAQQCPVILFVRTGDLPYWSLDSAHAVVLAGLEGNEAILMDPGMDGGPSRTSTGDLLLAWSHFDYLYAIVRAERRG